MFENRTYVVWNNFQCVIETDCPDAIEHLGSRQSLLGKGNLFVNSQPCSVPFTKQKFHFSNKEDFEITVTDEVVTFGGDWRRVRQTSMLECFLLSIFERELQLNYKFSAHASAVSDGQYVYMFVGPKEAGKTTIAYKLCTEYGWKLVGNDHLIIGNHDNTPHVFRGDGNHFVTFRSHALQKADPKMFNRVFGENNIGKVDIRHRVTLDQIGIEMETRQLPLRKVFLIDLGLTTELDYHQTDPLLAKVTLYDNLSSFIRGASLMLFDEEKRLGPWLPDFGSKETHQNLVDFLNTLIRQETVYTLRGPLESIIHKIYRRNYY